VTGLGNGHDTRYITGGAANIFACRKRHRNVAIPTPRPPPKRLTGYPGDIELNLSYTHAPPVGRGVLHKGARLACGGGFKL
jgi:hypothetical protein